MHNILKRIVKERGRSQKKKKRKEKKMFSDNHHMETSWFKCQLASSNGVGCSEDTYTNTYIVTA